MNKIKFDNLVYEYMLKKYPNKSEAKVYKYNTKDSLFIIYIADILKEYDNGEISLYDILKKIKYQITGIKKNRLYHKIQNHYNFKYYYNLIKHLLNARLNKDEFLFLIAVLFDFSKQTVVIGDSEYPILKLN